MDIGTLVGIGSSIKGLFGGKSKAEKINKKNIELQRETNALNAALQRETNAQNLLLSREERALQREFAKMGLRWKVADAKAAGLHPLFGIGGVGASYSPAMAMMEAPQHTAPQHQFVPAEMGQGLDLSMLRQADPLERQSKLLTLEQQKAGIAKDYAQTAYWDSEAARTRETATNSSPFPSSRSATPQASYFDTTKPVAAEIQSKRSNEPSVTAGTHAGSSEYDLFGVKTILPSKESSEAIEALSESMAMSAATVLANERRSPGWSRNMVHSLGGPTALKYWDIALNPIDSTASSSRWAARKAAALLRKAARNYSYGGM